MSNLYENAPPEVRATIDSFHETYIEEFVKH